VIAEASLIKSLKKPAEREKAFKILLDLYQKRLYWHIRKIVLLHEDADDVLQNTFIKVYKNVKNFEEKSKLYTWIYRIATNEAITFLNQKKRNRVEDIDAHTYLNDVASEIITDGDHISRVLQNAIAMLPMKQKSVFLLRYYQELSYKDISEILGTSIGGLKASYHHAVKKIETYIKTVESS